MSTPTQATDATENDKNRPMVTSIVSVFSGGGEKSSFSIIPTTNQMKLDDSLILCEQLRKPSSEESVVIQGLQSTDLQTTDPMSTFEARSVIEMGYSKTAVQLAIHEYNGKNPTKGALSFSAADLVQILVGRQERGEEIPQDLPSEELGATGSSQQAAAADPMSTSEVQSVIEMGYSRTAVQLAIHEYNRKNPTNGALSFSAADLVQILVGRQERGEEIPQDLPSEELGATGSSQLAAVAGAGLMDTQKCKKCHINDSCMQVLPCNHCCLCVKCAHKASHCPMCRRRVELRFRSYNMST
ncbi:baculoviral IAP repeat-containing protein 7-like [Dreissena polymorpha]|uniref:RING-type domain-containing protein n=1 Tax=Dreissena polymorpha TaxID=45954 RepID=A0A9D4EA52_DREPO|nr:baculoviral IAP repeat-containing protein 7-like [Dreissena polymorpha]KAH3775420.1 hypothetical protein DPMN_176822 [Dreissena polymorpha]